MVDGEEVEDIEDIPGSYCRQCWVEAAYAFSQSESGKYFE